MGGIGYVYVLPQCALCKFRILDGEIVLARIDGNENTNGFLFREGEATILREDKDPGSSSNYLYMLRIVNSRQLPCFHASCFNFHRQVFEADVTSALLASMLYTIAPPFNHHRQKFDRTRRFLASQLRGIELLSGRPSPLARLPHELMVMIATFLVRECAIVSAQESSDGATVADLDVDLSQNVYVQYELIDGVRYVRTLQNRSPIRATGQNEVLWNLLNRKLLDGRVHNEGGTAFYAWDHLGIRAIRIALNSSGEDAAGAQAGDDEIAPGAWWRQITWPAGTTKLRCKSNGGKIRDLEVAEESASAVSWASTTHPSTLTSLITLLRTPSSIRPMPFDDGKVPMTRSYPRSLVPDSPRPSAEGQYWLFSSCVLKDVISLTVCRDISLEHKPVIGILVHYRDGHRACVGQFRFDKTMEHVPVDHEFYIQFERKPDWRYVAQVVTCPPDAEDWIKAKAGGKLEWWFTQYQCIVYCA
ncbi:hypothetical protein GQ53DRAFT_841379 [Thozetella sp. PMI_491]|nr:hypothetical protein GQ53DRAFT_841379 [Thozetella sp. PMI_491]